MCLLCSAPWFEAVLFDSCPSQIVFCSPHSNQRLIFYPHMKHRFCWTFMPALSWGTPSSGRGGLSRDNWYSHFLPAWACQELSGPLEAESMDEYKNQNRALEALRGCQSSEGAVGASWNIQTSSHVLPRGNSFISAYWECLGKMSQHKIGADILCESEWALPFL